MKTEDQSSEIRHAIRRAAKSYRKVLEEGLGGKGVRKGAKESGYRFWPSKDRDLHEVNIAFHLALAFQALGFHPVFEYQFRRQRIDLLVFNDRMLLAIEMKSLYHPVASNTEAFLADIKKLDRFFRSGSSSKSGLELVRAHRSRYALCLASLWTEESVVSPLAKRRNHLIACFQCDQRDRENTDAKEDKFWTSIATCHPKEGSTHFAEKVWKDINGHALYLLGLLWKC